MVQSSAYVTQLALNGAARIRQGEVPELKNSKNLSELHGRQNLDFFEEGFKELQSRDNSDGDVSIHIFTAGPDQDPAPGKLRIGNLEVEYEGDAKNGTRFSTEDRGEVQKIKAHRFDDSKVVVYEATVKPNNEMNSSVLILDRQNPGNSVVGQATADWILSL